MSRKFISCIALVILFNYITQAYNKDLLIQPTIQSEPDKIEECYSILSGDTLRIGNNSIERVFLWNDGDLQTCWITDKKSGKIFKAVNPRQDFVANREEASDGRYMVKHIKSDGITPSYQVTTVSYKLGSLEVERDYRVYPGVAAIAVDTRLRGHLEGKHEKDLDGSERSNIEHKEDTKVKPVTGILDRLPLAGNHWKCRVVDFRDVTDWYNTLVEPTEFISYRKTTHSGNILIATDLANSGGLVFLKEAPCSSVQLNYDGNDFISDFGTLMISGTGVRNSDLSSDNWTSTYSAVVCTFGQGELSALQSLRQYQKQCRLLNSTRDEMVMMNTWGDRSQDSKVTEDFCLAELELAASLGITIFQIDDGWQSGKSPNSKTAGGSFKDIYARNDYWTPDPGKYPRGLSPIIQRGRELGIEIGLWFNPSIQNDFADWEKDAAIISGLWKEYGIRYYKIDGITVSTKKAEENLRKLFDKVLSETDNQVVFNLDATASRRMGYHYFNRYGNIFLENRYTDWGNYYPYHSLRNLWMLCKYVPAERLQIEFLNKWRNTDKYSDDPFAPNEYGFDYIFAITMAGQPLAWMEASNLPVEAYSIKPLIENYRNIQHDFHKGTILPVGEEPSGSSWTGFQSILDDKNGYFLIFREKTTEPIGEIETWLDKDDRISMVPVEGIMSEGISADPVTMEVGDKGRICFTLDTPNSFALYRYTIE